MFPTENPSGSQYGHGGAEEPAAEVGAEVQLGLGICPALLLLPADSRSSGGLQRDPRAGRSQFSPPHRCEPQPRPAPAAAQPWSALRKEGRRVRFQLDKARPEAEGSPGHPGNGRPPQPLDRAAGENELRELEEKIQEMRDQLRAALLRKSELVSALGTTKGNRPLPAPLATEENREER